MSNQIKNFIANAKIISGEVQETFGELSVEQINWKPNADEWSVGQCLNHLIKTNEAFNSLFAELASGNRKQTFFENYSPLTSFFGNFLLKAIKNDAKKYKAPSKQIVPPTELPSDIVKQFLSHQNDFTEKVMSLEKLDWSETIVTSPFMKIMTYRLDKALEIALEHEKRHIRQAKRVMEAEGFPQ